MGRCQNTVIGEQFGGIERQIIVAIEFICQTWIGRARFKEKRAIKRSLVARGGKIIIINICLLYTSPSPRDTRSSRMPSSA